MKMRFVLTATAAIGLGSGTAFAGGTGNYGGPEYFSGLSAETLTYRSGHEKYKRASKVETNATRHQHKQNENAEGSTDQQGLGPGREREIKLPPVTATRPSPRRAKHRD